jgi:hypothetical protein
MLTVQPAIKNGRNVWNQAALPRQEFEQRVARLRAAMAEKSLDLVLVHAKAFNGKVPQNVMVALPREGEPTVFFEGAIRGLPSVQQTIWCSDLRAGNDVSALCEKYLEKIPATARVGLVGARPQMPYAKYRSLRKALGERPVADHDGLVSAAAH